MVQTSHSHSSSLSSKITLLTAFPVQGDPKFVSHKARYTGIKSQTAPFDTTNVAHGTTSVPTLPFTSLSKTALLWHNLNLLPNVLTDEGLCTHVQTYRRTEPNKHHNSYWYDWNTKKYKCVCMSTYMRVWMCMCIWIYVANMCTSKDCVSTKHGLGAQSTHEINYYVLYVAGMK